MRHFHLIVAALLLCACADSQHAAQERLDVGAPPPPHVAVSADMAEADDGSDVPPAATAMLAYRYGYGFALPAESVEPTMDAHMEICLSAGAAQCQVLGASTNTQSEDRVSAQLSLRAAPDWLVTYRETLQMSVEDADGRVTYSNVSAEDLTRQILDTDARLAAQITLRERLNGLLETRDAELSDLLALEREIARVQGEIESATATLKALRQRVNMSIVDINYQSRARAVSQSAVSPIVEALRDFLRTLSYGLATVIGFFAIALPWLLLVILPGLWLLRWLLGRRKTRTGIKS